MYYSRASHSGTAGSKSVGRSTAAYLTFIVGNAFGQACNASGIVVDALTAPPVPHAQVTLQSRGAASDATGHWSIAGVPCGAARFIAERPGYLQSTSAPLAPAPDMRLLLTHESSIEGKVLDETGDPIVGAEIQVYDSVVQRGRRVMRASGTTNTNGAGEFRIGGLSANKYRFCAHSSKLTWPVGGGDPLLYTESCYPAGQPIRIASGVELRQNFTLAAVKGVHVRGVVSGIPEGASAVIQLGHNTARIATGGTFDLADVAPGIYSIEGFADVEGRSALASTRVEVGGANLDNVILTFVRGVQVTGTVLSSPEDMPLTVSLVPSDPSWDAGKPEWDASRRTFTFASVAPGKYTVAIAPLRQPYYVKSIQVQGQDISDEELTITSAVAIEIAVGEGLGSLEGMVADSDGKPVAADVLLLQGIQSPWRGTAQPDGRFTMNNLPPGDYNAYAFGDARDVEYADPSWMQSNAAAPVKVTIQANAKPTIHLTLR